MFKPIQNMERGISEADVIRIYQGHGFMSLPLSGISMKPFHPDPKYQSLLDRQPEEGVDLEPILQASEKFLRVWEYVIEHKAYF